MEARCHAVRRIVVQLVLAALGALATGSVAYAQPSSVDDLVSAVVRVKAYIEPDGRTVETLGRQREGSGVILDHDGHVLTIGYLIVEARAVELTTDRGRTVPATVVGFDHETGFGVLRALVPLNATPIRQGRSADIKQGDPVLVASFGGLSAVAPALVAAKHEFAGSWEYLLDEAIFTVPPHPAWSGAALLSREGKLVGIGSLIVGTVPGARDRGSGNMFVPTDLLAPILSDLIANRRPSRPARPWLGLTTNEVGGDLLIVRVVPGSPAARAGLESNSKIVGVNGERPTGLADLYRKVWAVGRAGAVISLDVSEGGKARRVDITSSDRLEHLKLNSTL